MVRRLESVTVVAAIVARSAEDHLVCRHGVAASVRDALDRRLEAGVLERLDLPAVVADEVVMMVAARVGRLEACDAVAEVDPLHEPERVHTFECAVDARDSDTAAARAHFVVDLLRRQTAILLAEELDDESPRALRDAEVLGMSLAEVRALPTDPVATGLVLRALSVDPLATGVAGDCAEVRAAG